MADDKQGKGRAGRGRARGHAHQPHQPYHQPYHRPGPSQGPPRVDPPQHKAPTTTQYSGGRSAMRNPAEPMEGVVEAGGIGMAVGQHGDAGSGVEVAGSGGRGAVRGGRNVASEILRTRPENLVVKRGTTGDSIEVLANYFTVVKTSQWSLYQYRVDFAPDEDRTPVRKGMMRTAAKGNIRGYIFDGTVLYTIARLPQDPLELFVQPRNNDEEPTRITIRLVGDVGGGDFHYLQIFNVLMRKCLGHLKLQLVGRNFFDALAAVRLPDYGMELWPGYSTSIRQHENRVLMCCEITHKVMRLENVASVLDRMASRYGDLKQNFEAEILGAIVLTDYNNRTYRIDEVDWNQTPLSRFEKSSGVFMTYVEYYKSKYNIAIRNMTQPLLLSMSKAKDVRAGRTENVLLVPELCRMTGLTDEHRNNQRLMRALADHTRVGPADRVRKLLEFSNRMSSEPKIADEFQDWDLRLDRSLVQIPARVLPTERIVLGRDKRVSAGHYVDWTKDLRSNPMISAPNVSNWFLLTPYNLQRDARGFMQMVHRAGQGLGMNISQAIDYPIDDDRSNSYVRALADIAKNSPQIVVAIVPNNRADRYAAIKKMCYVDKAIPCQVIQAKNFSNKGAMSIATKIAIQINCKVGGAPWSVEMPLSDLMVVGFDVCPDKGSKGLSHGAMVASINKQCTRYFSTVSQHHNGDELSNQLALNLLKAVKKYTMLNGRAPNRILLYRDGVGDGQLNYVYDHEIKEIQRVLTESVYTNNDLRLCVIIVSKRINTRFFTTQKDNPRSGTVVDDVVTIPERYDFFIVSQCTRQGSVAPTSYNVLYDTLGLDPDKLQRLTYKFTHLYFNWSGTVRVPAPCQYAHKLAFLVGQFLHRKPQGGLEDTLFYL